MSTRALWLVHCSALALTVIYGLPLMAEPESDLSKTVKVSYDGRDLEIKRTLEDEAVRVHVLGKCGNPALGESKIRHILVEKDHVTATYGKHCAAKISLKTFAVECIGCD